MPFRLAPRRPPRPLRPGARARAVPVAIVAAWVATAPAIAESPPPPVKVGVDLVALACAAPGGARRVDADVARGLLAFNTPYLFGGRALRTNLTCGACHGPAAPSGAAARFVFRIPVPDIALIAAEDIDVGGFAAHSIEAEFDGPPPPTAVLRGLAALARVMAPRTAPDTAVCRIDAPALIDIELRLIAAETPTTNPDTLDFLIDSTRFALGQMQLDGAAPAGAILVANAGLRAVSNALDAGGALAVAPRLGALALSWERMMRGRGDAPWTLGGAREASR